MTPTDKKRLFTLIILCAALIGLVLPKRRAAAGPGTFRGYLPIVLNPSAPTIELEDSWSTDAAGEAQQAFKPGEPVTHIVSGLNAAPEAVTVTVRIDEAGPCAGNQIYSDTVVLPSGPWEVSAPAAAPECSGHYTATTTVQYDDESPATQHPFLVNDPVSAVYTDAQGFDRCKPPTIEELQAWWNESPYYVYNIYLGGIHYPSFCIDEDMDAFWVREVAAQGWQFTATWVGPQAPCSNFTHRISASPSSAYSQGQDEANAAAAAARRLGLFGDLTLIYDIEGYGGDEACRNAVDAFIQGWTDEVHELGYSAGAYGSPCNSHILDWHDNDPAPDQVWIARWALPAAYDPDATVWGELCGLTDAMWSDKQRIRQYAGDHVETWGGVSITVDSNVFDTFVIEWQDGAGAVNGAAAVGISSFAPTGDRTGWLLAGSALFRTPDLGETWTEITPAGFHVYAADFLDPDTGWAAGWTDGTAGLAIAQTTNGGGDWVLFPLQDGDGLRAGQIGGLSIEAVDPDHVFLSVQLPSGSTFSLGRLFASRDGGTSWEERVHPLGEPAEFEDPLSGWTSGGPDGQRAYRTTDGGVTWAPVEMDELRPDVQRLEAPSGTVQWKAAGDLVWALVQNGVCEAVKDRCTMEESLWFSGDDGATWTEIILPGG